MGRVAVTDVLVAYSTRYGSTADIAHRIADVIRSDGHHVTLADVRDSASVGHVSRFDAACIGGAVYSFGRYPRTLVRFVQHHQGWLSQVPSAFFSVGLARAGTTPAPLDEERAAVDRFLANTGWKPGRIEFIAGALRYSQYTLMTRRAMRRAAARYGGDTDTSRDYSYTDWEQVDRFAHELAEGFGRARA